MKNILITYAVEEEFYPFDFKCFKTRCVHTGIGKSRSAMMLTKSICEEQPDIVLNVGTAGSIEHSVGDILVCRRFVDRDFEKVKLPGIIYELDFTKDLHDTNLFTSWRSSNGVLGVCNTGDQFVTNIDELRGDIVDMEAFAQAVVCKEFNIPFIAVKYVTDIIGQNSVRHWEDKLADARRDLKKWFEEK